MFSYVRFLDDDVREGEDTDEDFYKSQILLLADTQLQLKKIIEKSTVPVTKIRILDEESDSDVDCNVIANKKSLREVQTLKKLKTSEVTACNFKEILKQAYAELEVRYRSSLQAYKKKKAEATAAKEEVKMLREKMLKQEEEVQVLRELNISLQRALLEKLGTAQSPGQSDAVPTEVVSSAGTSYSARNRFSIEDGKVFLGGNIFLEKEKWDIISKNEKDSIFIKDMATAIWGNEKLKGRSLEGIPCNRMKSQGATTKPALTPEKLAVVKDTFAEWLRNKNISEEEILLRTKKYKWYISDKIMYINRKYMKESIMRNISKDANNI